MPLNTLIRFGRIRVGGGEGGSPEK